MSWICRSVPGGFGIISTRRNRGSNRRTSGVWFSSTRRKALVKLNAEEHRRVVLPQQIVVLSWQ